MFYKEGLRPSPDCDWRHEKQNAIQIVDECNIRRLQKGMKKLHKAITDTVQ